MVKTIACRNAIGQILQMLVDDQQIPEDFMRFIDQCLSDYFYKKKLDYIIADIDCASKYLNYDELLAFKYLKNKLGFKEVEDD